MASPFDDAAGVFLILVNAAGEYSLWPAPLAVPSGWTVTALPGGASRQACLDHIAGHWSGCAR